LHFFVASLFFIYLIKGGFVGGDGYLHPGRLQPCRREGYRPQAHAGGVENSIGDGRGDRPAGRFAGAARRQFGPVDQGDVDLLGRILDVEDRVALPVDAGNVYCGRTSLLRRPRCWWSAPLGRRWSGAAGPGAIAWPQSCATTWRCTQTRWVDGSTSTSAITATANPHGSIEVPIFRYPFSPMRRRKLSGMLSLRLHGICGKFLGMNIADPKLGLMNSHPVQSSRTLWSQIR
jgi:hypothetical protein